MLRNGRPHHLTSTFLALSLLLTGCQTGGLGSEADSVSVKDYQSSDIPPDGTINALTGVKKSYEHGTLPSRTLEGAEGALVDYAHDVYVAKCLVEQGFEASPVRAYDWNDPSLIRGANAWGRPLSVDEASQYGFQVPRNARGRAIDDLLSEVARRGSAYQEAFDACNRQLDEESPFGESPGIFVPLTAEEMNQPEVAKAAEKWRECMKELGAPDLSDGEPQIPRSITERFPPIYEDDLSPTSEEIDVAMHVARCHEESRFNQLRYGLNWVAQERHLQENEAEYRAILSDIQEYEQQLKDYIEANRHLIG